MTVCTAGMLVGDSWMMSMWLAQLSSKIKVDLICGSYALPVWEWVRNNVCGARYSIYWVVMDPDDPACPYCPGFGYPAINAAHQMVGRETGRKLRELNRMGSYYHKVPPPIRLTRKREQGEHITLHPYTRHSWKNVFAKTPDFQRPVKIVGLPGEYRCRPNETYVEGFENQVEAVLTAYANVGVLSSFSSLASLFQLRQLVISFTPRASLAVNPNARVLVTPTSWEVNSAIAEMGM